jgi:hypothetical protein
MKRSGYVALSLLLLSVLIVGMVVFGPQMGKEGHKRSISSITPDETMISTDAHQLTVELGKVDSADSLNRFIIKHTDILDQAINQKRLDSLPADYRLIAALLYPVKNFRGFGHRIFGLSKPNSLTFFASKGYIIRNILLSKMQGAASHINTYFPKFGADLLDWIAVPYKGVGSDIEEYADLQNFMIEEVYFRLQRTIAVLNGIQISSESPMVIDSTLFTGPNVTPSVDNRYIYLFPHTLQILKAGIHQLSHNIIINSAYNKNDLFAYQAKVRTKLLAPAMPMTMFGMPASKAVKIMKRFPKLYTLRKIPYTTPAGDKQWFNQALSHLQQQVEHERSAISKVKDISQDIATAVAIRSFFNPKLGAYLGDRTDRNMNKRTELVNNANVPMRHWITGDMITVNYLEFYQKPPKDLKEFLPISFDTKQKKVLRVGDRQKYYNYRYGLPTAWNLSKWKPYFPSVATNEDIKTVANVLRSNVETNLSSRVIGRFVSLAANFKVFNLLSL